MSRPVSQALAVRLYVCVAHSWAHKSGSHGANARSMDATSACARAPSAPKGAKAVESATLEATVEAAGSST